MYGYTRSQKGQAVTHFTHEQHKKGETIKSIKRNTQEQHKTSTWLYKRKEEYSWFCSGLGQILARIAQIQWVIFYACNGADGGDIIL